MAMAMSSAITYPAYSNAGNASAGTESALDTSTSTTDTSATNAASTTRVGNAGGVPAAASTEAATNTTEQALLEAEIAAYQQQLQQLQSTEGNDSSDRVTQQLEQRIAARQLQLSRLGGSTSGTLINTFA